MNHTPGPWKFEEDFESKIAVKQESIVSTNGALSVRILGGNFSQCEASYICERERLANARLIAAAPEMLEALKGCSLMLNTTLKEYRQEPWAQRVWNVINKVN